MTAMEDNDQILIGRYVRGEAAAFDQLYKRYELEVWRYLQRNVGDQATSDELLQEVWLALARNAVSLESVTRFRTRLYTVAYDRMSTTMRARAAKGIPAPAPDAAVNDPADALSRVIAQLPTEQREAYLLQIEAQLSPGDIAEITESSLDTVESRLQLARAKLHELLSERT